MPYYALRPSESRRHDSRGLRKYRFFRPPENNELDCIYEAKLSLLVVGIDEFFWTAYFCEDMYYTGENPINDYLRIGFDGSMGGQRNSDWPIWDPRYYFLMGLSIRAAQITMEWSELVHLLENYLDPLVSYHL
jgi:hypothetical protein